MDNTGKVEEVALALGEIKLETTEPAPDATKASTQSVKEEASNAASSVNEADECAPSDSGSENSAGQTYQKQYLLLIDLNGTMCHRARKRIKCSVQHSFRAKAYYVYPRPSLAIFMDTMQKKDTLDLYINTSITRDNAMLMVKKLLPDQFDTLTPHLFGQEMSKPDPKGKERWDTMRDLNRVWNHLSKYGPSNTIVVDNDAKKCRECLPNTILVPPFINRRGLRSIDVLPRLQDYLTQLADAQPEDVRTYLQRLPFLEHKLESDTAVAADDAKGGDVKGGDAKGGEGHVEGTTYVPGVTNPTLAKGVTTNAT